MVPTLRGAGPSLCLDAETLRVERRSLRLDRDRLRVDVKRLHVDVKSLWLDVKSLWVDVKSLRVDANRLWVDVNRVWVDVNDLGGRSSHPAAPRSPERVEHRLGGASCCSPAAEVTRTRGPDMRAPCAMSVS
jgi:hypothetical protein